MKPLSECRLYAFVDTGYLRGRSPADVAHQLCEGGADLIQLRAKQVPPEEIRRLADAILPVTRRAGIGLVINDHPWLARELGASSAIWARRISSARATRMCLNSRWQPAPAKCRPMENRQPIPNSGLG